MGRRRPGWEERREARFRALKADIVRPEGVDDDAVMRVMRVPPEMAGVRVDRFLQTQLRATSRSRAQVIIGRCAFTPAGQRLRKGQRLLGDDRVVLWRPPWDEDLPDVELPVVYEDEELLAVNKPPGMVVHPTARHYRSTVSVILAEQRPDEHLTLLHRIDRETSGVLLLARTRLADRLVKLQFEERRDVVKRYVAIAWGDAPWETTTCELPLEADGDSPYRVKMRVAAPGTGQASGTTFEVLDRRARPDGRRYTMLRCTLHTGRQHQIRVHAAALGLPLVGDKLYGPDETMHARQADGELTDEDRARLELPRQALHAADIEIEHPTTEERLRIEAEPYEDMVRFWDRLSPEPSRQPQS